MSEGFNLQETRRFIRTNKEKETKEHERQDFWCFAASGKSFMLPIAILPVAGLLLGIGSSLQMQQRSIPMDCRRSWEAEHYLIPC